MTTPNWWMKEGERAGRPDVGLMAALLGLVSLFDTAPWKPLPLIAISLLLNYLDLQTYFAVRSALHGSKIAPLANGQRILFQVSHQDRGRGVPPPSRQPYPHGGDSHGYRVRECISSIRVKPTLHGHPVYRRHRPPLEGGRRPRSGREVRAPSGRKCLCDTMRQGDSPWMTARRYLYWYQHNPSPRSIPRSCFALAPGGEREPCFMWSC